MTKRLSEQLADLSVRAKNTEDAWAAAEKEAHEKIAARKAQARAAATAAVEKVNQEVKSANDTATRDWNTVKAKIAADMNALKADFAEAKHERDVKRAEKRADRWSGRQVSPSTTPSRRSNKRSWPFSMPSTAAWPPKKPSKHRSFVL